MQAVGLKQILQMLTWKGSCVKKAMKRNFFTSTTLLSRLFHEGVRRQLFTKMMPTTAAITMVPPMTGGRPRPEKELSSLSLRQRGGIHYKPTGRCES
eukprot:gene2263-2027_t